MPIRRHPEGRALAGVDRFRDGTTVSVLTWLLLSVGLMTGPAQEQDRWGVAVAVVPLFTGFQDEFSGKLAAKDYFVRLPEHVSFRDRSELRLLLRPSPGLAAQVCAISLAVNGRLLMETNLHSIVIPADEGIAFAAAIPRAALSGGW